MEHDDETSEASAASECAKSIRDWLHPSPEDFWQMQREAGVNVDYFELQSKHGHDSFLAEPEMLVPLLQEAVHNGAPSFRQSFCPTFSWLDSAAIQSLKEIH